MGKDFLGNLVIGDGEKPTAETILEKHFELAKIKYPNENWKKFDEVEIEKEFCKNAMNEFAIEFGKYLLSRTIVAGGMKVYHKEYLHDIKLKKEYSIHQIFERFVNDMNK